MKFIKFLLVIFITINLTVKVDSKENLVNELKKGGNLIFIRHAYAPGGGDPNNFDINNWDSKKNLIFVTHYVVISEILNYTPSSGEIVVSNRF